MPLKFVKDFNRDPNRSVFVEYTPDPCDDPRRTRRGRAVGYPRRGSWQRELKEERRRRDPSEIEFFVGIDLGQAGDYTAIAVLQRTIRDERAHYVVSYATRVRHVDYMEVVNGINGLFRRPELPFAKTELVVDCTGVGRAVVDAMDIAGLWPARVTITGGQQAGGARLKWNVPKKELVFATLMALEQGRLKVVPGLACGDAVKEELRAFGRSTTAAGNARFEATGSQHDDLVTLANLLHMRVLAALFDVRALRAPARRSS